MIEAETDPGGSDAEKRTTENIDSLVLEVDVSSGGYIDGKADGYGDDDWPEYWRRCRSVAVIRTLSWPDRIPTKSKVLTSIVGMAVTCVVQRKSLLVIERF